MKRIFALAGLLFACTSAQAVELQPLVAERIALGDVWGATYYTVEENGFEVVMAVSSGDSGSPIQFVTTLGDGEKTTLSVPRPSVGMLMIEIRRVGDRLFIEEHKQ